MTDLAFINYPQDIVFNRGLSEDNYVRTITFYGTYDGSTDVEYQLFNVNDDSAINEGWTAVTKKNTNDNTFSIDLELNQTAPIYIQVRYVETVPTVQSNRFSVGLQIYLMGEINASLLATRGNTDVTPDVSTTAKIYFGNHYKTPLGSRYYPLKEQFIDCKSFGLSALFESIENYYQYPVAIIVCAENRSSIKRWRTPNSNNAWGHFEREYHKLGGNAEAFIFVHGETDANQGMSGNDYRSGLVEFYVNLKQLAKRENQLYLFLSKIGMKGFAADEIYNAQISFDNDYPYVYTAGDLRDFRLQGDRKSLQLNDVGVGAFATAVGNALANVYD